MEGLVHRIYLRVDRKVVFSVLACALIGTLGFLIFVDRNPNHRPLTVVSLSEKTDTYSVEAEYPQFGGLSKSFNKKIEQSVLDRITEFKKTVSEEQNSHPRKKNGGEEYVFRVSWVPDQLGSSIVSVLLREYSYVGGAHGSHNAEAFTFDAKNNKELSLGDIFSGVPGYLDRISQYTMNDIKNQLGSEAVMDMIRQGTTPNEDNFAVFTLSRDNMITFYFKEYQVAPFASGEQRVSMPISFIKAVQK